MLYSVAMTSTGQVTLPKELRVFLGLDGAKRITLEKKKDRVEIKRKANQEDFSAQVDAILGYRDSKKVQRIIDADLTNGVTTIAQIREKIAKSPAEKKRMEKKYGRYSK